MSRLLVRRTSHRRTSRVALPKAAPEGVAPIIVDLGKKKAKAIKALKRGDGRLMDEVDQVISDVGAELGADADKTELVPIVLVYRRKEKRRARGLAGLF